MTTIKTKSTDWYGRPMPPVITDAESAREAALAGVTTYCGWCNKQIPSSGDTRHDCRVSDEAKRLHLEGARKVLEATRNYPCPPCMVCNKVYPPGSSHDCSYPEPQLPHDRIADEFQHGTEDQEIASLVTKLKRAGYRLVKDRDR